LASNEHKRKHQMEFIGCSVQAPTAQAFLRRATILEGAELRVLPYPLQRIHSQFLGGCAGLVFDLAPWNRSAVELVQWLRSERPFIPILLYPPHVPGVDELILACGAVHGVSAHSQFDTPKVLPTLRHAIRRLPDCTAGLIVSAVVSRAVRKESRYVLDFVRTSIHMLQTQQDVRSLRIEHLALKMRTSTRSLHRVWQPAPFPQPKELLSWVVLAYVSFLASYEHVPVSSIAVAIGMDRQRLYRLRKRLLPETARADSKNAG